MLNLPVRQAGSRGAGAWLAASIPKPVIAVATNLTEAMAYPKEPSPSLDG